MERLLYTVDEVAGALGIGRTKVYELLKSGALSPLRIGQARRIPADAVSALIAALAERPAATGGGVHTFVVTPSEPSVREKRMQSLPDVKEAG